jgi:hypothetical protein
MCLASLDAHQTISGGTVRRVMMSLGSEEKSSETDSLEAFRALNIDIVVGGNFRCASRLGLRTRPINITSGRLDGNSLATNLQDKLP